MLREFTHNLPGFMVVKTTGKSALASKLNGTPSAIGSVMVPQFDDIRTGFRHPFKILELCLIVRIRLAVTNRGNQGQSNVSCWRQKKGLFSQNDDSRRLAAHIRLPFNGFTSVFSRSFFRMAFHRRQGRSTLSYHAAAQVDNNQVILRQNVGATFIT